MDDKQVNIQQPPNAGSHYYDYKGHNSILAMVAVGPVYEIVAADVGINGRMSDRENWSCNKFREMIASEDNPLQIPSPKQLATFSKSRSGDGNDHQLTKLLQVTY